MTHYGNGSCASALAWSKVFGGLRGWGRNRDRAGAALGLDKPGHSRAPDLMHGRLHSSMDDRPRPRSENTRAHALAKRRDCGGGRWPAAHGVLAGSSRRYRWPTESAANALLESFSLSPRRGSSHARAPGSYGEHEGALAPAGAALLSVKRRGHTDLPVRAGRRGGGPFERAALDGYIPAEDVRIGTAARLSALPLSRPISARYMARSFAGMRVRVPVIWL